MFDFFFFCFVGLFFFFVLFCFVPLILFERKKDPNSTIHDHVKRFKYFSWQAERTSGNWEVAKEEEIEGDLHSCPLRSSSSVRLQTF